MNWSRASIVQFRASRYIMGLNRTSEWKDMSIWIARELLSFNFERVGISCPIIGHSCEKLWQFEFLESFCCSILCVSICYVSSCLQKLYIKVHFVTQPFKFCRINIALVVLVLSCKKCFMSHLYFLIRKFHKYINLN